MAASISDYYNKNINNYKKDAQEAYNKIQGINNDNTRDYVNKISASYDTAIDNQKQAAEQSIAALPQQYQSAYDRNELNRILGERQLKERMSNLGLTDSGLNRTQMSALRVQQNNADSALTQQKTAAANTIRQQLNEYLAEVETAKAQAAASANYETGKRNSDLYASLYQNAQNRADSYAQAEYAAQAKAQIDAIEEKRKAENNYKLILGQAESDFDSGVKDIEEVKQFLYRKYLSGELTESQLEQATMYMLQYKDDKQLSENRRVYGTDKRGQAAQNRVGLIYDGTTKTWKPRN